MPKLTIEEIGTIDVPAGKRLINAIIDDAKADQHYSCGGNAKCTTCRVQFISGEPDKITQAEKDLLAGSGLDKEPGVRLSCQITCEEDLSIKLIFPKPPLKNPAHPGDDIQPPPVWTTK
jgi:ferredoxin